MEFGEMRGLQSMRLKMPADLSTRWCAAVSGPQYCQPTTPRPMPVGPMIILGNRPYTKNTTHSQTLRTIWSPWYRRFRGGNNTPGSLLGLRASGGDGGRIRAPDTDDDS